MILGPAGQHTKGEVKRIMPSDNPSAAANGTSFEAIRLHIEGNLAWLRLSRPEHGNALTAAMAAELVEATHLLEDHPELGYVVLIGDGGHFCLGGDLHAFRASEDDLPNYLRGMLADLHRATASLLRMRPMTIAAVNGTAAGAGLSLVCATDLAISAQSARYTLAYTRVGLSPNGGSTWLLPRIIGTRRATEMAYTNRLLSATEALEWGLVNRVVADDELENEASQTIERIAAGSLQAQLAARTLLRQSSDNQLETQMELEGRAIIRAARLPDAKEGIAALLDKRPPTFAHTR
jgi:2-(1,2-epoxy-1,2-dihydrophenyl)acetyl-CoA isomerase